MDSATPAATIGDVTVISTSVTPVHGVGGYYAVLDGRDAVLAATPFSPAPTVTEEFENASGVARREQAVTKSSVVVYMPFSEEATRVRILDHLGTTLASVDREAFRKSPEPRSARSRWQQIRDVVVRPVHAESQADLEAAFPHIRFITDTSELGYENAGDVAAVAMWTNERATAVYEALSGLGPALVGSIGSIAFVRFSDSGVGNNPDCGAGPSLGIKRGQTVNNQIVINMHNLDNNELVPVSAEQIRYTVTHESVHAFNNLVDNEYISTDQLPADVQVLVDDARDNLGHMFDALRLTWTQLQETAKIAHDGYGTYAGGQASCTYPTVDDAVAAGFARPYGGTNAREDVATLVQVFNDPWQSASEDPVCQQFSGLLSEIPRDKLLMFAKVNFLRGLELITESDYQGCVQDADPADRDSLRIGTVDFSNGLKAGDIDVAGGELENSNGSRFIVLGSSSQSRGMLQIYARPPRFSPVGFHRLDKAYGWFTPYAGPKGLKRRNMITVQPIEVSGAFELNKMTRISSSGFALIVSSAQDQKKGYAFFVKMEDPYGKVRATLDLVWFRIEN